MSETGLFIHHDLLGHVPNPGFSGSGFGASFHTIDSNGLRYCGKPPDSSEAPILTIGDSFTYGDEVKDEETWPAQLQKTTGRRVLNGGVTGFGFDQMVIRAEQLVAEHKPSVVIVSLIHDDVRRVEMRTLWWRNKPWFEIEGNDLKLKGVPVPQPARLSPGFRRLIEPALLQLPTLLQEWIGYHRRVHHSGGGMEIAKKLVERLASMQLHGGPSIILVSQYPPYAWSNRRNLNLQRRMFRALFDHAAMHHVSTIDTFDRLSIEPKPQDFYAYAHMNARGNLSIARLLAVRLPELSSRPASSNMTSSTL